MYVLNMSHLVELVATEWYFGVIENYAALLAVWDVTKLSMNSKASQHRRESEWTEIW